MRHASQAPAAPARACPNCGCQLDNHGWRNCPRCHHELPGCMGCGGGLRGTPR